MKSAGPDKADCVVLLVNTHTGQQAANLAVLFVATLISTSIAM